MSFTLKRILTIPLGSRGIGVRVEALVEIDSAEHFTLELKRIECGSRVYYTDVPDEERGVLASWVNDCLEQFADYERDQRERYGDDADYERWRDERDMRKAEGE